MVRYANTIAQFWRYQIERYGNTYNKHYQSYTAFTYGDLLTNIKHFGCIQKRASATSPNTASLQMHTLKII